MLERKRQTEIDLEGSRKGDDEIKQSSVDCAFRKLMLEEE